MNTADSLAAFFIQVMTVNPSLKNASSDYNLAHVMKTRKEREMLLDESHICVCVTALLKVNT